jgi:4-aminobutyrate aminotransferase-like enzyme
MRGIELVADRGTREPSEREAARLQEALRERGVIVGRSGQFKNVLRINPPLCVTEADADHLGQALEGALAA